MTPPKLLFLNQLRQIQGMSEVKVKAVAREYSSWSAFGGFAAKETRRQRAIDRLADVQRLCTEDQNPHVGLFEERFPLFSIAMNSRSVEVMKKR